MCSHFYFNIQKLRNQLKMREHLIAHPGILIRARNIQTANTPHGTLNEGLR
jgi:hypothetical protein